MFKKETVVGWCITVERWAGRPNVRGHRHSGNSEYRKSWGSQLDTRKDVHPWAMQWLQYWAQDCWWVHGQQPSLLRFQAGRQQFREGIARAIAGWSEDVPGSHRISARWNLRTWEEDQEHIVQPGAYREPPAEFRGAPSRYESPVVPKHNLRSHPRSSAHCTTIAMQLNLRGKVFVVKDILKGN